MKICLIADGRSTHTQRWAEYFSDRHEVHLITYDPVGFGISGVTEHVVHSAFSNLYLSFWPRHMKIRRLIREIDPDIVHAHFITKYGFHLPKKSGRKFPVVVSAWGDDILILPKKSRIIKYFTGRALCSADLVYAVSEDIKKHILAKYRIESSKVHHMPLGVDTSVFAPATGTGAPDGDEIIVFSNRGFFPVYNMATMIRGFARAWRENGRLRLVLRGEGPELADTRRLAESEEVSGAVTFLTRTGIDQVPLDYRLADIFVSTAVSDGTPVSLLEAMASGLPCIATAVGGVPEWIEDGVNGVLIPPRDPAILAEKILLLASDREMGKRLSERARDLVVEKGDCRFLMEQAEKDYDGLIKLYKGD